MLSLFILALAPAPPVIHEVPIMREMRQGPYPVTDKFLLPGHRNSDDRMFPDIAVKDLRIDGDTLFVRIVNLGRRSNRVPVLITARAGASGVKSESAEARTGRILPGESRWIPVKGFAVKTASRSPAVFALDSADVVSAVARLVPSTAGMLDRSGLGCGDCSVEADERNNALSLARDNIRRGKPD